ncbi:MAG: LacI family DNA-binding transcriptional regulator [Xanthomonadales bacterium]
MGTVSIKDVARLAGVSIATVSRAVNEPDRVRRETRERVQDAIRQTGYAPNSLARSFRRGRTQVIMVVLPSVGDPFFTEVMRGVRAVAAREGYSLLINETQFNTLTADEIGAMVVSRQADGIILLASLSPFGTRVLSAENRRALPMVIGCETIAPELSEIPGIHIDNVAAAREATAYLQDLGHRRIAFMYGEHATLLTADREAGYRQAMDAAALPVHPDWIVEGQLSIEGAIAATSRLLELPERPTAIFCANDEMAMGCMHALKTAGLAVPRDVSVVGFDDTRYARITDPPLTTVRQPARLIGERVMERLLLEIGATDADDAGVEILPHELIIRASAAPPSER